MAFNGTWKVVRNENYDRFIEQMGECARETLDSVQVWLCEFMRLMRVSMCGFSMAVWVLHRAVRCSSVYRRTWSESELATTHFVTNN